MTSSLVIGGASSGVVKYPQNGAAASYVEEPPGVASTRREDTLAAETRHCAALLYAALAGMRFNDAIVRSWTGVAPGATHERSCRTSRPPTPRGPEAPVRKATLALPCR